MNTRRYENLDPDVARGLDALVHEVSKVVQSKRRCCLTCINWNHNTDGCNLAGGQVPPPRVVAYGCNSYVEDDIPF